MTFQTKSGIFVREEPRVGLLTFSPFSGLFYACAEKDKNQALQWLDCEISSPPSKIYEKALGAGWSIDYTDAEYPKPHLLPPSADDWKTTTIISQRPFLINWLITGNCPLHCRYCYAQDLMHGNYSEPSTDTIKNTAKSILKYQPLVVVLTGGDPLVSPYFEEAIKLFHKKVGIIVDTSAFTLTQDHIRIFKEYGVFVRISLDSEIPRINNYLRPTLSKFKKLKKGHNDSTICAVEAILACLDNNIRVGVQSVVTKKNRSDFGGFGDKLHKLGVSGWRILMIASSKCNADTYLELRGTEKGQKRFYSHILRQINAKYMRNWHGKMAVQVADNQIPNAIILVAPDGTFLTESHFFTSTVGKIEIDPQSPKEPNLENIHNSVNMHAHIERYLNLGN